MTLPTIACLVRNSVSHDARVLKEAEALVAAGYRAVIIGVQDRKVSTPTEVRPSGLRIIRVPMPQAMLAQRYARQARVWAAAGLASVALVAAMLPWWASLRDLVRDWATAHSWDLLLAVPLLAVLAVGVLALRRAMRSYRSTRIKRRELAGTGAFAGSGEPGTGGGLSASGSFGVGGPLAPFAAAVHRRLRSGVRLLSGIGIHRKSRVIAALMQAELDRIRPDSVHCHDLPTLPVGAEWRRRHPGAKVVFDSHEIYDAVSQMPRAAAWMWRRMLSRHAAEVDLFITINDSIAALLRERDPALPPAVVIRNAARLPASVVEPDGRLRAAAGIEPGQRVLLYQGGYQTGRGLPQLLRSAMTLPPDWVLVMMGFGSMEGELRTLAAGVDPEGRRIRFIPPAPHAELVHWTADADLGLIPYENTCLNHWLCSPNNLWEYPVAGVPMLVSPFPELRATVERHVVGRCLPEPLDAAGLAATLDSIGDEELRAMRRNCRRYLEQDHWGIYAERLVEAYRGLLGPGRGAAAATLSEECRSSPSSELVRSS